MCRSECARVHAERLRSDPTSVLTNCSGGVFTNHTSHRHRRSRSAGAPDTNHSAHRRTSHTATVTPIRDSGRPEHARPTAPLQTGPPHTPHPACACLLASARRPLPCVLCTHPPCRQREATFLYSEHSRSRSAADRIPPPRSPACHMMNVPKKVPRPSTFTHDQHDARGCRATP